MTTVTDCIKALRRAAGYAVVRGSKVSDTDADIYAALADALERAKERCALHRPDGSIVWETLSDPLWGASRRADGMEVFDYLVISLDKEQTK
jgi:hypothetical protein